MCDFNQAFILGGNEKSGNICTFGPIPRLMSGWSRPGYGLGGPANSLVKCSPRTYLTNIGCILRLEA